MNDRDDFSELVASARNATKSSAFYFTGRIRYGTKGEKVEERLLCMDAVRVYICPIKIPVKIESQFNILSIKLIEKFSDSHVTIEADEKQIHSLYSLQEKASLQAFLICLIRTLHNVFPHRLQAIVEFRPENEYDKLFRLANENLDDTSCDIRPCGGFSHRYECACDFYQVQCYRSVQNFVDTVFAHRLSREFTFHEFESLVQKDWLPIISALRYNEWFTKITIENVKLSSENIEELCHVARLCKTIKELRLINCTLSKDFGARFGPCLSVTHVENLDLSNNALEDKGLVALSSSLHQRKLPLRSLNLQSCSITHKSLHAFNSTLINNHYILKTLQILNLSGNRIKEENCITQLFANQENVLEELHLSDIEFNLDSFFHSLSTLSCKLRRLYISSLKVSPPSTIVGGVKAFFTRNQTLEILQLSNANLSNDFLRELCDGLHSNVHLTKLDLRLPGNQLESFVRESAPRIATIPGLTALDITGCDLDNEMATLLMELKKNRHLKSIHIGKNFNNIKTKNMPRTIQAMKDLLSESDLQFLSIADSKLKENLAEILAPLTSNTSLKILDIRGNIMGDAGVRVLTHILKINRHLHTIYFDRNQLSLNNFEDIINAMEENHVIQYLPIPITDIILMKTTEKDRMEKLQYLMNKLDALCIRNQTSSEGVSSADSLVITPAGNLTREMSLAWDNEQQLFADQTSLDYILSCSNRMIHRSEEIQSLLTRTSRIAKISSQLSDIYLNEEEQLKEEWNHLCRQFEEKYRAKNERLSKRFYQLFKEQTSINYDDKFQEQIRTYFGNSNEQTHHLLNNEIPSRLTTYSRECYVNVVTGLQKRAYDTTNEIAIDMHKQMETAINQAALATADVQPTLHTPSSTLDRLVSRGANVVHRLAHKHNPASQTETTDETVNQRPLAKPDSSDYVTDLSPQSNRAVTKENRILTSTQSKAPTSPKPPPAAGWRRSVLVNSNEPEPISSPNDLIYNNAPVTTRPKKKEIPFEDEGDLIEHDLLNLVEQEQLKEQQRSAPPAIPAKKKLAPHIQENNLDVEVESSTKLIHPGKDRPRRANIKPPVKRSTNGASRDSSSDGGLDNDDSSLGDVPSTELSTSNLPSASVDPQTAELPPKTVAKIFKTALKPTKDETSSPPPVPAKLQSQSSVLQTRPLAVQLTNTSLTRTNSMSKSITVQNSDSPPSSTADSTHDMFQGKPSMSASSYASMIPSTKDEQQKETHNSSENLSSPLPPVSARTGKVALGTRVLPVLDPNGDAPPVRLRHCPPEKKVSLPMNTASGENPLGSEGTLAAGDPTTSTDNEQYKRLSVKERARMLTTTIPPLTSTDKKPTSTTPPSNTSGV